MYTGIYRGVVEDVNDPLKLGRCRVRVPSIHGPMDDTQIPLLPWARHINPTPVGMKRGSFIPPHKGDIVFVFFEGGDKLDPVFIGSSYGIIKGESQVPLDEEDVYGQVDVLYSSQTAKGTPVALKRTTTGLNLSVGETRIQIYDSGDIAIESTSKISIHSKDDISIKSDTRVDIDAPRINLN